MCFSKIVKYRKYKAHYFKNEFELNVTTLNPNEHIRVMLVKVDRIVLGWSHPVFTFLERKPEVDRCFTLYQGEIGYPMKVRDESSLTAEECCAYLIKILPRIELVRYEDYQVQMSVKQSEDVRWLI